MRCSRAAVPEPAARGQLVGLRRRLDLNGRRVEVKGEEAGKDGPPRFRVELLFGVGAGTVLKVKAANLDLDRDRVREDEEEAGAQHCPVRDGLQALKSHPLADLEEDPNWRDWAGGVPTDLLAKVAETLVAQTEAGWAAHLKEEGSALGWDERYIQEKMAQRKRDGTCLFAFAMVHPEWREAQLKVGGRLRTRVVSDVAMPGRVALAKWALAEGCPRQAESGFIMAAAAAQFGHMVLMQWLIQERGFAMTRNVINHAARSGNFELVRWLRGKGCGWSTFTCMWAALGGHLEVLQWLRANGCPWDADTCSHAAAGGHLETLRWARENGCDWNARTCFHAAYGGHLDILQWLRANGCPWDSMTCWYAVDKGHVEVLRWARENGCPWDAMTRIWAANLGYTDDFDSDFEDSDDEDGFDDEYSDDYYY